MYGQCGRSVTFHLLYTTILKKDARGDRNVEPLFFVKEKIAAYIVVITAKLQSISSVIKFMLNNFIVFRTISSSV